MGAPTVARRYNYLLGGKDHVAADRESAQALKQIFPAVEPAARENRFFMRRVVHYLAAERGIRQFIDIGVGLPFAPNVHEVAQAVDGHVSVVYVDNDPVVAVHARALLAGSDPGLRVFVEGDLRDPEAIVADPLLRDTLDLNRPVAVLMLAVLHYIVDDDVVAHAVRRMAATVAAGSYLALSHVCFDAVAPTVAARLTRAASVGAPEREFRPRSAAALGRLVDDLHPVAPGLVPVAEWRPGLHPSPVHPDAIVYGAVARTR